MARMAQCHQIPVAVISSPCPGPDVVHLQVSVTPTELTRELIPDEDVQIRMPLQTMCRQPCPIGIGQIWQSRAGRRAVGGRGGEGDSDFWSANPYVEAHEGVGVAEAVVPEPLTMLGVFLGVGGLGAYLRKRQLTQ